MAAPLSTLLSQVLVAHTIELDNEFERRFAEAGGGARVASLVMWSNLLRFVGDGTSVGELVAATGLQPPQVLSALGGVERWRYVVVSPPGAGKEPRDGYGSARALKDDFVVRFSEAGERAAAIWPELPDRVADRWRARFGDARIAELEAALRDVVGPVADELPAYVPILVSSNGLALELPLRQRGGFQGETALVVLLARAAMRYGLDFERESPVALALSANVLRVLDATGVRASELPARGGISKEAVAMALTALRKTDYVAVDGPRPATAVVRLTRSGQELVRGQGELHGAIESRWSSALGADVVTFLRGSLDAVLDDPLLPDGLRSPPGGWRAGGRYRAQTDALLSDPRGFLPHAPMVLHRGGWPDGS